MLGPWWLPNPSEEDSNYQPPEHWVAGEFSGDGPWNLATIGALDTGTTTPIFGSLGKTVRHDAIWGTTSEGKALSLFDALRTGVSWQSSSPMGGTENWHVDWYTSGTAWVERDAEVDRISLQCDVLDDWASESILASHNFPIEDGSMRLPEGISYRASIGEATVTLDLGYTVSPSMGGVQANRSSAINIVDEAIPLDKVVSNWVVPLLRFLELLTAMATRVTAITVRLQDTSSSGLPLLLDLHPNLLQPEDQRDTSRGQLDMLTTRAALEEIGLGFSNLIATYLALHNSENHRTALHYLSRSQSRVLDRSTTSQFLTALSAVELYHREKIGGSAIPADDYERRVEAVVASAPGVWRQWTRDMLSGRNNKGLKKQLKEVIDQGGTTGETIVQAWPGSDFCRQIVKYRGIAAHGTSANSGSLGSTYYAGATCIRWLLRHVYLRELGLPAANVGTMIQNNQRFQREMRSLGQWVSRG